MIPFSPDIIIYNGKITTLDAQQPEVSALAIGNGHVLALGSDGVIKKLAGQDTQLIDLKQRRVIPGLNDSHLHAIRAGLNYTMELRWDGVPSLECALEMLKQQVARTPVGQWVRVIGGWSEFQFHEKRMPTLAEINAISSDVPIFILHLYDRAFLNAAAVRAVGYTKDTPNPKDGKIERDEHGNPTGLLIAEPNATILYATLAKGPKLSVADQLNSTRHFMRELNRFGLTSCIDAGGGFQNYPEDYQVIETLHARKQLTVRVAYNLFTQKPLGELADFTKWVALKAPYAGDSMYRLNGAGEMLVYAAADFEDFSYPRPDMPATMEDDLKKVVQFLVENHWPFRIHTTYNETITRVLNVFDEINKQVPLASVCWFLDHVETISDENLAKVKALGGAVAIQDRMAFQGEQFIERYGKQAAAQTPPIRKMLELGITVGAGTDATRVASYNPWVCLYWLVTGKTVGGTALYNADNTIDRLQALRLYTQASASLSKEEAVKGALSIGMYADLAVLSQDYFTVPEDGIKAIESVLTIVDGNIVYATQEFADLDTQKDLPLTPAWSPVKYYGGYYKKKV